MRVDERWKVGKITTVEWKGWWGVTLVRGGGEPQLVAVFPAWRQCFEWLHERLVSDER